MRKMLKMSIACAMMMGIGSVSAQADGIDIVSNVAVKGEIRARYEMVDQDGTNNANAFTNRLTIGASADLLGTDWLSAYAEMTNVSALNDNYDDLATSRTANAIVADPEQTRLTQAYLDITIDKRKLRLGRQMINLDNQRFIGAVGWRQMFQTFDAATLTCNTIENLSLFASYITQRNTIFEDGGPKKSSIDARDALVNVSYKVMPELKVTAYSYMLGTTHDTYGLALTGKVAVADGVKVNYRAEYATQTDPSMENSGTDTSGMDIDADYMNFELGVNMSGILAGIGYEVLSGAEGTDDAFTTPYATLHGKNGWADKFLATPAGGIEDLSVMAGYKAKGFGLLKVVYHDFQADTGTVGDYGTEIDAMYKRAVPGVNGLVGMLKVAAYDADNFSVDTTKVWVMLDYKFSSK